MTTVILLATLTFFFLPHTVYFFISLNSDASHEHMSTMTSFLLVLYMTLLPYLKMISDPLVYGVRMCRRTPAGVTNTSRAVFVDAASTAAVLRSGQTTAAAAVFSPASQRRCCAPCVQLLSVLRRRRSVQNPDTYTAVVSSVPHVAGPHSWKRSSARGRLSVYNAIRLQTLPASSAADDNIEEIL